MPLPSRLKKPLFILCIAAWLGAAAWGAKWLQAYSFAPGANGQPSQSWPAGAGFSRADGICTLVLALHPECSCSRATLAELDSILVETTPRLRAFVIFIDSDPDRPASASELFKTVRQFPGVTVIRDRDGAELHHFGFLTSGETRLYRPDGTLAFKGGITISRGHEGDNPGRSSVIALARAATSGNTPAAASTPVFGCALFSAREKS